MKLITNNRYKIDVPTLETCKELDFKNPTYFVWFDNFLCRDVFKIDDEMVGVSILSSTHKENDYVYGRECVSICNAPQISEIMPFLPEIIKYEGVHNSFYSILGGLGYMRLFCEGHYFPVPELSHLVLNNHYAEAYAQVYLKLRNAGLLRKEVKDE